MTFIRRITKNGHTYVYEVRSYREKGTGRVRQATNYLGMEIERRRNFFHQDTRGG